MAFTAVWKYIRIAAETGQLSMSFNAEASHQLPVKLLRNLGGLHPKTVKVQRFYKLQSKRQNNNNDNLLAIIILNTWLDSVRIIVSVTISVFSHTLSPRS